LPRIFHVNWFRQDPSGRYIWPGFGENLRVLSWIVDRCAGRAGAHETPIGLVPHSADLDLDGLDLDRTDLDQLLAVEPDAWREELDAIGGYLDGFGKRLPASLRQMHAEISQQLKT